MRATYSGDWRGESLAGRLYGAFKAGEPPPSDEDIERMRYEALMAKHS